MHILSKFSLAAALAFSLAPLAQANDAHHAPGAAVAPAASAEVALTEGEVKKINKETGKLTIKHGELKNLGMAAMTMAFRVQDAAMLEQVKVGNKIGFIAERIGGQLMVTKLEVQR